MKINITRDRELLGLPAKNKYKLPKMIKVLFAALVVFLISSGVGKLVGKHIEISQQYNTFSSVSELNSNYNIDQIRVILKNLRNTAVNGSAEAKLLYSNACSYAANILPDYNAWNEEGLLQVNLALKDGLVNKDFYILAIILKTNFLFDAGREKEAFLELKKLNKNKAINEIINIDVNEVEGGLDFYNIYAYMLATAKNIKLRNPELALKLITKVIIQPDGRKASYLDTLAEAYYSNNRVKDAQRAQRFALAKSDYPSLWMLTEHYRKFADN